MCASLTETFVSRYEGNYTLGRSSGTCNEKNTKRVKINDLLMDQVKAYVTLTIELISITKPVQMLLLAENIDRLQDLNSAARATRLVRKFSLKFLEGQCLFSQGTIQDEPSKEHAETLSNKVKSA